MDLALARRAVSAGPSLEYRLPPWAVPVLLLNLVVLVPLFVVVRRPPSVRPSCPSADSPQLDYSLRTVFPVFAMVEDETPPAYEPVAFADCSDPSSASSSSSATATDDEDDDRKRAPRCHASKQPPIAAASRLAPCPPAAATTSSLRATHRLLVARGGLAAYLRGFPCFLAQGLATSLLVALFYALFYAFLGPYSTSAATLVAALALVQLSTAWVHVVISPPSPRRFWHRLPPFGRTLAATWRPVLLFWLAAELACYPPFVLAGLLDVDLPSWASDGALHSPDHLGVAFFAKWGAVIVSALLASVFLLIPAKVVLIRVQASLLPVGEDTVIPFDRSFGRRVEPAVVGGLGYSSVADAWASFTPAAWRRLLLLYVKLFFVGLAAMALVVVMLMPQVVLIASKTTRVG